jgi:hypothetical protein
MDALLDRAAKADSERMFLLGLPSRRKTSRRALCRQK